MISLGTLVADFARGLMAADARQPQEKRYAPGIGPFEEPNAVRLVMRELAALDPARYASYTVNAPYPGSPQACDLLVGHVAQWAIEVKHARLYRNNGEHEPFEFQHLFSPYAGDRSALTDCEKLAQSQFTCDS